MGSSAIKDRIVAELDTRNDTQLERVLRLVHTEAMYRGNGATAGELLREFGSSIPDDELDRMEKAIEEGCERVDPD